MPFNIYPERGQAGPRHTKNWSLYDPSAGTPPGTGAWVSGEGITRPMDWDWILHLLYPSGSKGYPLTALISKMSKKIVTDPRYHWFGKSLPSQSGEITGVFSDAGLVNAYAGGGIAGDLIFVQMSLQDSQHFRDGHEVMFSHPTYDSFMLRGKVVAVAPNGTRSFVSVYLLEADSVALPNASALGGYLIIIGDINPEFGAAPNNIAYESVKFENYTQIFRQPVRISNTALHTAYRLGTSAGNTRGDYAEQVREALELHGMQKEKAFIFGLPTERVGNNGMPERTTAGILWFIHNFGGVVADFRTLVDPDFPIPAGALWNEWGSRFLDYIMARIFRYGGMGSRLCFCGWGAISGIQNCVMYAPKTQYTIGVRESAYGINITTLVSPFGELQLVSHPLFTYVPSMRNAMLIISMEDLEYRELRPTKYIAEAKDNPTSPGLLDGITEEYINESGLALYFPPKFGIIYGVGLDRP